mmetsp:Transcript_19117/g.52685  ORF Transcript_19117/g.52685 Transcript_19117/m.52685 type:complete len:392 (+) Transcript_19117:1517-2692(+)
MATTSVTLPRAIPGLPRNFDLLSCSCGSLWAWLKFLVDFDGGMRRPSLGDATYDAAAAAAAAAAEAAMASRDCLGVASTAPSLPWADAPILAADKVGGGVTANLALNDDTLFESSCRSWTWSSVSSSATAVAPKESAAAIEKGTTERSLAGLSCSTPEDPIPTPLPLHPMMALEGSCCSWLLEVGRERDTPRIRAPFPTPVRVSRSNSPPLNMANFPTPSLLDCGRGPARIPKPVRTCDVLADLALVEGVRRPFPRKGKCGMLWLDSIATVSSATPVLWSDAVPAGSITPSWCPDAKRLPRTPHIGMLPTLLSLLSESSGRGSHEVCQREATAVAPALTASPPPNRELTRPAFCDGVSGVLCLEVALPSLPKSVCLPRQICSLQSRRPSDL